MQGLLEVHVGDAVRADVVVVDQTVLSTGRDRLDQLLGGLDVVAALVDGDDRLVGLGTRRGGIVGNLRKAELLEVDTALGQRRLIGLPPLRVSLDVGSEAREAKEQEGLHGGECRAGLRSILVLSTACVRRLALSRRLRPSC